MYGKYFALFNDDVDSFVMFLKNSCEGKIFPFQLVKKLEEVDSKILHENGFRWICLKNFRYPNTVIYVLGLLNSLWEAQKAIAPAHGVCLAEKMQLAYTYKTAPSFTSSETRNHAAYIPLLNNWNYFKARSI